MQHTVTSAAYTDLYAHFGIPTTTMLVVQNSGIDTIMVSKEDAPLVSDIGEYVQSGAMSTVCVGKCWVRSVEDDCLIVAITIPTPTFYGDVSVSNEVDVSIATLESDVRAAVQDPKDYTGNQAFNTIFGQQQVAQDVDMVSVQFQYGASDYDTIGTSSGTGNITTSASRMIIGTGTGVGKYKRQSKSSIRYIPQHQFQSFFTAAFSSPETNTRQFASLSDETGDGIAIGYDGVVFGVSIIRGGVRTHYPVTDSTLNAGKYNIWKIAGGWLGIAPITVSRYSSADGGWKVVFTYDTTNTADGPHILNPSLPITFWVERTSGTGNNVTIATSSWYAGVVGQLAKGTRADRAFVRVAKKASFSSNTLTPVISIRNKTTFQSLINHVRSRYGTVALSTEGNQPVEWYVYKNATLTGAVWADADTNNSTSELDTSATAMSGGEIVGGTVMSKSDKVRINLFENDAVIDCLPGEWLTLACQSSQTSAVIVFLRWIEEF